MSINAVAAGLALLLTAYVWFPGAVRESSLFTCSVIAPMPNEITWNNNYWQEIGEGSLFILSAYEDRRFQPHYVRIMGMESVKLSAGKLTCVLWYGGGRHDVVAATRLRMWIPNEILTQDGSITHIAYVYSCPISDGREISPSHVSLAFDLCDPITNAVDVTSYGQPEKLQDQDQQENSVKNTAVPSGKTALCVKPMNFPRQDIALRLAEWIEIQRAQGVDAIFTYVYDVTDITMMVLRQYQQQDVVDFVFTTLPGRLPNDRENRTAFLRRTSRQTQFLEKVILNDCFYRHLAYDYVAILDVDEVVFPLQHHTLPELLDELSDVCVTFDLQDPDVMRAIRELEGQVEVGGEPSERHVAMFPDLTDHYDKEQGSESNDATRGRPVDEEFQLALPCASYCFRQSFFLDEFHKQDHDDIPEYLHVMQHTNRSMRTDR
ncbi:PREDICTED: uncharacterized protein LOC106815373 [Priapulus caudatus]|uniref:Glycosyltransferase family 92 protein n=1 Tax=Priapulus caudatus TaxID=37621 RepID=A0ABM1ESZ3_PRICU|nr:PREDICTED: uncharacterized protein LOC106815373 [Priapulus caudatus]XP_014675313.1 PREDICTED: uncharacterized protein LOC106815373 [Priapulus caudatus]XP_014675314.1 PREDICTED: uncharacterized protein LOC106815373 [Priapulus caudatus]